MGLFGTKETQEEKQEKKAREILAKYELHNLSHDYANAVKNISLGLAGTGGLEFGSHLVGMKNEDTLKIAYLNTLIQQNWIIIRQLDEISKKLDK